MDTTYKAVLDPPVIGWFRSIINYVYVCIYIYIIVSIINRYYYDELCFIMCIQMSKTSMRFQFSALWCYMSKTILIPLT